MSSCKCEVVMKKTEEFELIELVQSYPENYSPKELSAVIWAETGEIVSPEQIIAMRKR